MAERKFPVYPKPLEFRLRTRTLKTARQTFARIFRTYAEGKIDHETFRNMIYGLSNYLDYLKTEAEINILDRLAEIERRLKQIEGDQNEAGKRNFTTVR